MVGIKFSSRDNMKLVEWIGLVYNDISVVFVKSMIVKIGLDVVVKIFVFI